MKQRLHMIHDILLISILLDAQWEGGKAYNLRKGKTSDRRVGHFQVDSRSPRRVQGFTWSLMAYIAYTCKFRCHSSVYFYCALLNLELARSLRRTLRLHDRYLLLVEQLEGCDASQLSSKSWQSMCVCVRVASCIALARRLRKCVCHPRPHYKLALDSSCPQLVSRRNTTLGRLRCHGWHRSHRHRCSVICSHKCMIGGEWTAQSWRDSIFG